MTLRGPKRRKRRREEVLRKAGGVGIGWTVMEGWAKMSGCRSDSKGYQSVMGPSESDEFGPTQIADEIHRSSVLAHADCMILHSRTSANVTKDEDLIPWGAF